MSLSSTSTSILADGDPRTGLPGNTVLKQEFQEHRSPSSSSESRSRDREHDDDGERRGDRGVFHLVLGVPIVLLDDPGENRRKVNTRDHQARERQRRRIVRAETAAQTQNLFLGFSIHISRRGVLDPTIKRDFSGE
ncbi:unnamed protein product [Urochloa humidicola]